MSASRRCRGALFFLAVGAAGTVLAADAQGPDMAFVEYLGLWDGSDEDWLMIEHQAETEMEERNDSVPEGEESTEDDHES